MRGSCVGESHWTLRFLVDSAWKLSLASLLCVGLLTSTSTFLPALAESPLGWSPASTGIFVVGVLKWKSSELSGFSVKNRRDAKLVNFFREAGVPDDRIVYLDNENATLPNVMTSLKNQAVQAQPSDTLVFYYCGHGWLDDNNNGYLANYDAGETDKSCLAVKDVVNTLKNNFKGSQLLMLADCCCSGSIADELKSANPPFRYGVLTSAVRSETSQSLLDALNGHSYADDDKDGKITFGELGSYIKREMNELEGQGSTFESGNGFDRSFVFATVVDPTEPTPKNVEVKYADDWWKAKLLEVKDGQAKIHWVDIGWDSASDDTVVPVSDVRPVTPGKRNRTSKPASEAPRSTTASTLVVGKKVKVLWEGSYYPASILNVNGNQYLIHYDGYESSDDEWVDSSRIK